MIHRLLTVGHSYVVGLNRRLAHEMVRAGAGRWEVTAAAPEHMHGDLRPIRLEPVPGEACRVEPVRAYFTRRLQILAYGRRLRRLLAGPWDLVHCWEEPYVLAGFQVARWTPRRIPTVFWTAQNLSKRYPPPFAWFERACVSRCSGWLACGRTTADAMLARGYGAKPHRIMPLGVDPDVFRPDPAAGAAVRRELGWEPDGPPVVGYLGRFVAEKGVRVLAAALEKVRTAWRAMFVGGGPLEAELRAWGERFPGRVRVVTGVPHERVPAFLNAMDVLAAPSQTMPRWREQLGRMLIEAMACGKPCVGSDSGEIPYVLDGAGVVVPEADVTAWADTIGGLLDSPTRRSELADRGRALVLDRYAWDVIGRAHLEFFDQILGGTAS